MVNPYDIIGAKYIENLAEIRTLVERLGIGVVQEDPLLDIQPFVPGEDSGRCFYDQCPERNELPDVRVLVNRYPLPDGSFMRTAVFCFHHVCLEDLDTDPRLYI